MGNRMFVITWRPGPDWQPGLPITAQPLKTHQRYFAELDADGRVVIAGPFIDEASGGLAIVKAASREEAVDIMEADPAVTTGIFAGTVRPFHVVFGRDVDP